MVDGNASNGENQRTSEATRARILAAAQTCFATHGYVQGSVREIARQAGIAPSLVIRYFGNKEALFEAAFRQSLNLGPTQRAPDEHVGEAVVALLSADNRDTVNTASMLALSVGDPQARAIAMRLTEEAILTPLAQWFRGPHARGRAELHAALTIGYTVLRLLVPEDHADADDIEAASQWISRTLQGLVDPDALVSPAAREAKA